jgi:hypothetical integral membrane protein (TIGR02206 family)
MSQYFLYDYSGNPFILFGTWHLVSIFFFIVLNFAMLGFRKASEKTRRNVRITLAIILWVNEAAWHIWNLYWGHWNVQTMLPLHVCSIMIWLAGFMLIFKNYRIYEFAYFLGIGAALQAFLTPDAGIYGFPHFRVFQTQIAHGLLITSAIYMTTVEGLRPTWRSFLRVAIGANIAMVLVFCINLLLGSNYMMVNGKPATASLLDMLPAWPYYIPFLELIGLAVFLLLYLPFIIKDARARRQANP